MRPEEARALARWGGRAASGIAGLVQDTHHGVTDRVFDGLRHVLGAASPGVRRAYDALSAPAFFWVRHGLAAGTLVAEMVAEEVAARSVTVEDSVLTPLRAQLVQGIANGVVGDRLAADDSCLAVRMALREGGRDIPLTRQDLEATYAPVTSSDRRRLVVFLHGLIETELAWGFAAQRRWGAAGTGYPSLLREETDWLPLTIRFNTGLPIADNARSLDALLTDLVAAWPVPVDDLVLVGHSMGGLVALTATADADPSWGSLIRAVVTLGSPRDGAPLERFAATAEELARRSGVGRWLGGLIGIRSGGIRDLHGPLQARLPSGVGDHSVVASLTPQGWHPTVPLLGDGLVPLPVQGEPLVLSGVHHLDLLNHPLAYAQLRTWLAAFDRAHAGVDGTAESKVARDGAGDGAREATGEPTAR